MLTESQHKTLQIIRDYIIANGFAPTISEILQEMKIKSRSLIQRNLRALETAGFITLLPNKRRNIELLEEEEAGLPLVGRIAAGQPIEAISHPEIINIPKLFLGPDRYLLEVKGDSMIGDSICDGDLVVCEYSNIAREGDIAVALIDNEAATLKRVHHNKTAGTVSLIPSNPALLPMEYQASRVTIQGLYLGLLRIGRLH
jgi:repressor LexA